MARSRTTFIAAVITLLLLFSYVLLPSSSHSSSHSSNSNGQKSTYSAAPASITTTEAIPVLKTAETNDFAIAPDSPGPEEIQAEEEMRRRKSQSKISEKLLNGDTIMPKLGNETIKAELGRAAWKLLHTTLARFPLHPTPDEREALSSYLLLFARLYPCGECATHFQLLLRKYPPQTSSRDAASQWGCHIHNLVNGRLEKEEFDCGQVTVAYQCGCAEEEEKEEEEEEEEDGTKGAGKNKETVKEKVRGKTEGITVGRPLTDAEDVDLLEVNTRGARVEMKAEGVMNGG